MESPGLQMRMNHSSKAWHTPQVKGTSSLKSLGKRPLPASQPTRVEGKGNAWERADQPQVTPAGAVPVGEGVAALL